jgi:hypothetical protein
MHHHVFVSATVVDLCRAAGLQVAMLRSAAPCHIMCLCRVDGDANDELTDSQLKACLISSLFASDRQ